MKNFVVIFLAVVFTAGSAAKAQSFDFSKQLRVGSLTDYREQLQSPDKRLVEIIPAKTGIVLDIRYATSNNFMHTLVYKQARAFARLPVYNQLLEIEAELKKQGLGLKIFDGYRPYSVTVKFFEMARDTNFVADPKKGSRHNRGCAVDLTLIDLKTRRELPMPTGYDSFEPMAAANYTQINPLLIKNRGLLQTVMLKHGFAIFPTEWWHFDYKGWQNFELLDIPFSQL